MWKKKTTESKRYYYSSSSSSSSGHSNSKLFEQSLDVYKPVISKDVNINDNLPTVILVVGSGWVGHRAFIYTGTSWWNSSGPQTIASLGCTCVCVRHRGAFITLPSVAAMSPYFVVLLALLLVVVEDWQTALVAILTLATMVALLKLGGRGSATLDDMVEDVAEALLWVENNRDLLRIEAPAAVRSKTNPLEQQPSAVYSSGASTSSSVADMTKVTSDSSLALSSSESDLDSNVNTNTNTNRNSESNNDSSSSRRTPLVFGGYSSGGHVAATLLQRPDCFTKHGLPLPDQLFQGILMISGVLAVRPESCWMETPTTTKSKGTKVKETTRLIETPSGPRWLTDLVLEIVFGPTASQTIPSPLLQHHDPKLPHLLVGCRNEIFGLPWLDLFFCSDQYAQKVNQCVAPSSAVTTSNGGKGKAKPVKTKPAATYVQIESDHWSILNSTALRDVLQVELPKLIAS